MVLELLKNENNSGKHKGKSYFFLKTITQEDLKYQYLNLLDH